MHAYCIFSKCLDVWLICTTTHVLINKDIFNMQTVFHEFTPSESICWLLSWLKALVHATCECKVTVMHRTVNGPSWDFKVCGWDQRMYFFALCSNDAILKLLKKSGNRHCNMFPNIHDNLTNSTAFFSLIGTRHFRKCGFSQPTTSSKM